MPERIAALLRVLHVLIAHGRHLAATCRHRAAAPGFAAIAAGFGTADLSVMLAHLQRGILRSLALQRVLLARAARGRDLRFVAPSRRANRPLAATGAVQKTAAPRPAARTRRHLPADIPAPTLRQLEAQVRRRPVGRTIVDICLDLAVVPGLCTGAFWNELFDLTRAYGGSIGTLMRERCRRERVFDQEQDRRPAPRWNWPNPGRETIRHALGFFIGEAPVAPFVIFAPTASVATGPP